MYWTYTGIILSVLNIIIITNFYISVWLFGFMLIRLIIMFCIMKIMRRISLVPYSFIWQKTRMISSRVYYNLSGYDSNEQTTKDANQTESHIEYIEDKELWW